MKNYVLKALIVLLFVFFTGLSIHAAENEYISVDITSGNLFCSPKVSCSKMVITLSLPNGKVYSKSFTGGGSNVVSISELCKGNVVEGLYTFEVKLYPHIKRGKRPELGKDKDNLNEEILEPMVTHGHFTAKNSTIKAGTNTLKGNENDRDGGDQSGDALHYDDVIITGSLCVGFDCANGESFGYCTTKLKENNLQLCFEDTSAGSFPTNDWKIQINDTTSGGASYFTIWDVDGGKRPFTIEAGAPAHSLYVEDYGRVGLGTSIPYVELHIVDGDSPTIRLDQDGSSGWTAQRWDLCGNETNFFVRDVTNGSKLCFRIQPNTPSNTLCMRSTGQVGMGTWSPAYSLEVEKTGENSIIVADRTDGATCKLGATANQGQFGTISNHSLKFVTSNTTRISLDNDSNRVDFTSGARVTTAGVFQNASSRALKENIKHISTDEAINTLNRLEPVKYNYKADESKENYVGFIAEDVPELVATKDRKNMSSMDVVAVLTKVVQKQQKAIEEQQKSIKELKKKIEKLEKK